MISFADEVTWRMNHSLAPNIAGPHVGKEAVCAFNEAVFNEFYEAGSVTVEILDETGGQESSVVRMVVRAMSRRGNLYSVEYVLFAKTTDGMIHVVVELLDTHASIEQHQATPSACRRPPDDHWGR